MRVLNYYRFLMGLPTSTLSGACGYLCRSGLGDLVQLRDAERVARSLGWRQT